MTERNNDGKFSKGNPGGPGRPPKNIELDYQAVTMEACSLEDWQEIIKAAVKSAKEGDSRARTFLANYVIGKPDNADGYTATRCNIEMHEKWDFLETV